MRRFYALPQQINEDRILLSAEESRHAFDVLRMRAGDEANVFDGEGREYTARFVQIDKRGASLEMIGEKKPSSPESPCEITIAATVLHADKFELIIQKLVELGVVKLVPIFTRRSDVKPPVNAAKQERWAKIAMEAAKQSGRARLMMITAPQSFGEFIESTPADETYLFSEREGTGLSSIASNGEVTAVFGPKGGWDDAELMAAREKGIGIITLGGRILRAETAAIGITAILQCRFGDLN